MTTPADTPLNGPHPRSVDLASWLSRKGQPLRPAPLSAPRPSPPNTDRTRRAAAYLKTLPPAVSGQKGHCRTFRAACILIKGFDLSSAEARSILEDWNRACDPPWSDRELEHKLKEADKAPDDRPRGWLLTEGSTSTQSSSIGRKDRSHPTVANRDVNIGSEYPPSPPTCTNGIAEEEGGSRTNPHRLARLFLSRRFTHSGGIGLRYWGDSFHRWDGSCYRYFPTGELRAVLAQELAEEFRRIETADREHAEEEARSGRSNRTARPPVASPVTTRMVSDVIQALAGLTLVPLAETPSRPSWIDAGVDQSAGEDSEEGPSARWWCDLSAWPAGELIAARNALVHPPSFVTGAACMARPSPRYFNAFALDYDFDPEAPAPRAWIAFLQQVWPNDPDSIAALQEWFGYLLTSETRFQKILMMIGPKRSGRGTIARVLKALAGSENVVSPTLSTLGRPFGLSVLIDKPVAVFPDARLSNRPDNAAIVESLLSISGEDDQAIDRKHQSAWTGKLPTRFVLISNELPRLRDSSRALSSRLIMLRFTRSFYGAEDLGLYPRLKAELPGILLWAFEGWRRLQLRGRFLQPESGRPLLESMDELASPVAVFLADCCVVEPGATVSAGELYEEWRTWCRRHGREAVGDEQALGRDLLAVIPGLTKDRRRVGGTRSVYYYGVRLGTAASGTGNPTPA
ncbi:phage/plasmid primase, P4 family [Paludisphaera rhizosphaerae]|uniref:phage/plasmid primase, P4 family n=1 Tax=Paludisphaera rhizosphaerae TaxID=2711216 RepID=UPI0013EA5A13|nr:phage/plasmid primase, P4 family [Paludisphaera rhizosphaerae]